MRAPSVPPGKLTWRSPAREDVETSPSKRMPSSAFVPEIFPPLPSRTTCALPASRSAVRASAANAAWLGGEPPRRWWKRCPQPAEARTTERTKRNANAEAKRPTKPISAAGARTQDSKECLEREARGAFGGGGLAPGGGPLGRGGGDD